jgi:hypothetical protein
VEWLSDRLREPSTWAGIVTLVSMTGHITITGEMSDAITDFGVAVGGLFAVFMKDRER